MSSARQRLETQIYHLMTQKVSERHEKKNGKKFLVCLHVLKFVKVFKLDMSTYQRSSACVGGPVVLQPSSLCLRSLSRFFSYLALSGALPL